MNHKHLLLFVLLLSYNSTAEEPPQTVIEAAKNILYTGEGFSDYTKKVYGFNTNTQLSVGKTEKVYILFNELVGDSTFSFKNVDALEYMYYVPILEDGQAKAMFLFRLENGHWRHGVTAGAGIYREFENVRQAWPLSEGYNPIFLKAPIHYFHIPEKDSTNLTPIFKDESGVLKKTSDLKYKKIGSELKEIQSHIKK